MTPEKKMSHRWNKGYHFGMLWGAIAAGTVFFVNLIIVIAISTKYKTSAGIAIVQDGNCNETRRLDLWLHLLINVLSTLLLGASNYSMQCLAAPTREDIDKAHNQHAWMDVGVPSIRNLWRISWSRRLLYCCLFASSVPLHLVYNSVVFSSTSISNWTAFGVTSDFLAGAPFHVDEGQSPTDDDISAGVVTATKLRQLKNSTSLVRLEKEACMSTYSADIVSTWGDVLLVSAGTSTKNSFLQIEASEGAPICGLGSFCSDQENDPITWYIPDSETKLSHCMAARVQEHCRIQFNVPLMIAVIICNLIKAICIGVIVWRLDSQPLVTIGDAIGSFLDEPDPTTKGSCLATKSLFRRWHTRSSLPMTLHRRRPRWFASASRTRWSTTTILCTLTLGGALALLMMGVQHVNWELQNGDNRNTGVSDPFTLGFGAINTAAVLAPEAFKGDLAAAVLLANTPQLVLSFLYFAYNSLWTCMLLALEWSDYAQASKTLRVTSPAGRQRSTYRLQLPYRYGIPLLILSGFLHWLVSQSFFLVVLEYFDDDNGGPVAETKSRTTLGYSPVALLVTILTGVIVLVLGIAYGFRRYPNNGMPLAGSCSAAISAACHPPVGDEGASLKKVMWGACGNDLDGDWDRKVDLSGFSKVQRRRAFGQGEEEVRVGHCSFTSFGVEEVRDGELYA